MPLQIRRGTTAQRLTITPLPGELIYDTTTGQLYVGDGTTVGGATTTGISIEDAQDAAAGLLTSGVHSGITFTYNDAAGRIDATVTIGGTGPFDGDINGSVFADDSSILVDAVDGTIKGPLNALGDNHYITCTNGGDIVFSSNHAVGGTIVTNTSIRMIYPNGENPLTALDGFSQSVHSNALPGPVINFIHTRGTVDAPSINNVLDSLGVISFYGHDGTNLALGASITCTVDSAVTGLNNVPARIRIALGNGTTVLNRYEFDSDGTFKTNTIGAFSGATIQSNANIQLNATTDLRFADSDSSNYVAFQAPTTIPSNVTWTLPSADGSSGQVLGTDGTGTLSWASVSNLLPSTLYADVVGSIFDNNSTRIIDGETGNITGSAITSTNYVQLPIYTNEFVRNSSIPNPTKGMIAFVETSDDGGPMLSVNTDDTLPGWENLVTFDRLLTGIPSTLERDLKGSVFLNNSSMIIDGESGNVNASAITSTNFVQFPVYADVATRNAAIPNPNPGMVTFVSDNGSALPKLQVNTDGTSGGWVDLH